MASPGNPNQPGGGPFDMHKFFKPSSPAGAATTPANLAPINPQNPNNPNLIASPFALPSASYPPPTGGTPSGPFSYPPQSSPFHHPPPQFHHHHPHHLQQFVNNSNLPPSQPEGSSPFAANLHPQRSLSFPTPPLQPPPANPSPHQFQNPQNPHNSNNSSGNNNVNGNTNQNPGARLMALLSAPPSTLELPPQQPAVPMPPIQPTSSGGSDFSMSQNLPLMGAAGPNVGFAHPGPMRMPSSKLPKGRHLIGDHVIYDIDVRLPGEVQPQLEVTPITKYGSDPCLVLGRQIAVNKTYICYGLKLGAIRVLNINTALRSLLKGLAQRVTDMAFFAEDVHLLASASVDGRVYVWKITEGPDEEDKPQITGKIVIAVQFTGEGESVHPRVCWHCHKQEVLVVGIGRRVLRIDTTKVGKGEAYSAEEPLRCPIDKLLDGVQLVGNHDAEVTDLSMCQWMTTRLVSASVDGTIKIWEDRKMLPIAVLKPHDGQPVSSVTFLTAPHRPDHIILITGGPLNREMKIWASASEEGWLLPSDSEDWHCTQTMELKSSTETRVEETFFNQVVALSQAGLFLLANAKKNAIYAVHVDYGANPASTRMDYIAEFTVTMPILSFTGTSDLLPHGEQIVQVYCVQTQAIQQYALDLSQCLPPPMENVMLDKSDPGISRDAGFVAAEPSESKASDAPRDGGSESVAAARHLVNSASIDSATVQEFVSTVESKPVPLPVVAGNNDISSIASPTLPLSPRLSRNISGFRSPSKSLDPGPSVIDRGGDKKVIEYSIDRQMDAIHATLSDVPSLDDESRIDENKTLPDDISTTLNHPVQFKHPTHLVTPSEILMATSSAEINHVNEQKSEGDLNIQDVVINNDGRNVEVEVKVVGEARFSQSSDIGSTEELRTFTSESKEKSFYSQASDLGMEVARECRALSPETFIVEESRHFDGAGGSECLTQTSASVDEVRESVKDASGKEAESGAPAPVQQTPSQNAKGKRQKGKNAQGSGPTSPSPSTFNSADSSNDHGANTNIPSPEAAFSQIMAMQEMLSQLLGSQKDMQKQLSMMVAVPVTKEGRRLEAALGKNTEKFIKANTDALWARFQEENVKQEKASRDRTLQITNMITNSINKDLPAMVEKAVKKEFAAVGQAVARSITPAIEKAVSAAITESFQKGVADKAVNQLEKSVNSKLEATVARQIQAQFQTSGKQALQETLKSSLEASIIPAFEMSCRSMFEQVDATFQKGMTEHATAALQQFDSTHSPLALALRDAINSASSVTQTLSGELAEGHRKLLALAVAGANSKAANPLVSQLSNGPLGGLHEKLEAPLDPTKELSRLIAERKYEEAFTAALQRSDVSIVSWLCSQVELQLIMSMNPLPLSQGVLLSLLQQLSCDISKETPRKLSWMRDVLSAINPTDPMIAVHVRPIFEQVYQILNHHRNLPTTGGAELSNIRLILHVINSMLMTGK